MPVIWDRLEGVLQRRRPVVLVGQAPSRSSRPDTPLTGGRSGARIQELAGLTLLEYVRLFARCNLMSAWPGAAGAKGDAFPRGAARAAAAEIAPALRGRIVVAVGLGVARALGAEFGFPVGLEFLAWTTVGDVEIACLPHPSGVNLWWNDPANVRRARRFLMRLAERARQEIARC